MAVHSTDHILRVERLAAGGGGWLDGDTVVSPGSYRAAVMAAGAGITAVHAVLGGQAASVLLPGAAAGSPRPPAAAAWASACSTTWPWRPATPRSRHGLKRILIVDFDAHHGNGTQEVFYRESGVLYFSTHQFPFYPGTGDADEQGEGEGEGYTVNVPAGCRRRRRGDRWAPIEKMLAPVARRYRPQLILVSAGYDAHWADPLTSLGMSVAGFGRIVAILRVAGGRAVRGRIVLTLEGGYNLEALSYSVLATLHSLAGAESWEDPLGPAPRRHGATVAAVHGDGGERWM